MIHRAPWVLSRPFSFSDSTGRMIENGSVVFAADRIVDSGPFVEIKEKYFQVPVVDHQDAVLLPPLVNAHVHLELSCLSRLGSSQKQFVDFPDWIRELLRQRSNVSDAEMMQGSDESLLQLWTRGTGLIADIGNRIEIFPDLTAKMEKNTTICNFLEFLGLTAGSEREMIELLKRLAGHTYVAAHAPYSTGPGLIRAIKQVAEKNNQLFSIHVAESSEEIDFLVDGHGPFRGFLEERGVWDGTFQPPGCGAVDYLDRLGILNESTLCVHVVHVSDDEIDLLAKRRARICLCPGSNRRLASGVAKVERMIASNILPALGTDSLASNDTLDLWREMQLLRQDHPQIDPAIVLSMATRGGAESLGFGESFGQLSAGMKVSVVAARLDDSCDTPDSIYDYLTSAGTAVKVYWLDGVDSH